MKKLIFFALLLLTGTLALAQSVPTCNGFDALGNPAYFASGSTTPVQPCTDYFGVANYANSPLPAGPIDVTATGFTILNGGSGYSVTPTVTITDFYGTPTAVPPASCSATVTGGVITAVSCSDGGSGFVAPVVMITDATGTGAVVLAKLSAAGPFVGGIRKFMDLLPDLKGAIATPDRTTFPGSDYYEIVLVQTTWQMHSDLPATTVRGYAQVPSGSTACPTTPAFQYLGPVIVAQKNVPVRIKFTNCLPSGAGGNLSVPMDPTYMGAGMAPDGTMYLQNRGELHLHGGATPWISDGTPHQWTVPAGDFGATTHPRGDSLQFVPDMYFVGGQVVPQCSATVTANCSGGTVAQLPTGAANDPGNGSITYFYTNQQGGRLMFYHDHAYGITRLNVYVGEAAGYLLADPAEDAALKAVSVPGTLPNPANLADPANDVAHLIPLVIQDKTFVPNTSQLAGTDPTWMWGTGAPSGTNGTGDFWFPHVYIPNQNPADPGGANGFGRWDYGAWFFPPMTTLTAANPTTAVTIPCTSRAFPNTILAPLPANNNLEGCPITPNPSGTPEGFMDTPVVNGKAYPILHVAPEAYRFRILSVGNDRSLNLQLYVADATGKDVTMVPSVPPMTGSALPLCSQVNTLTQPTLGIGLPAALLDASGNPINGTGLPASCWPNYGVGPASAGIPSKQFLWAADGRDGGVPDPRTAGPPFIQIGTEGGLLPAPVVIPSTPVNYEANTRSITITNVSAHGLWVGPAERADAIVDFSLFGGKTLIMYNDAPTPAPAFDMRLDYFTGGPDNTPIGGAPSTVPGYGPNTRTLMQIVVDQPASCTGCFSLSSLMNGNPAVLPPANLGLPGIFAATQAAPVIPEPTYPVASGGNAPKATYARISDNTITYQPSGLPVSSVALGSGGSGYSAPVVSIAAPLCPAPCSAATATATVVGGVITAITLTSGGSGYTSAPAVNITDTTGTGASATAVLTTLYTFDQKAIQELFTLDYGRMNATLGVELPMTNFLTQTTIPFGYTDWATEIMHDRQKQIWKITHNGVDTHFIHFHLFNVQVLNRIGWDGTVRPPDQNELGWKETVRMNPLEDIVVAMVPVSPILPFPVPDSIRAQDTTVPVGNVSPGGVGSPWISGIDPASGNQLTGAGTTNALVNFGWEYVWHCHILGHEENDMMRPIIFQVAPPVPLNLTAVATGTGGVNVAWTDGSSSETSFTLQRDIDPTFPAPTSIVIDGSNGVNFNTLQYGQTVSYIDNPSVAAGTMIYYRVQAVDSFAQQSPLAPPFQTSPVASAWVGPASFLAAPIAGVSPVGPLFFGNVVVGASSAPQTVTLSNSGTAPLTINSISIGGTNAADFIQTSTCPIAPATLGVNANCTITLTFAPTGVNVRGASLVISSNDPANPTISVALSGVGLPQPPVVATPTVTGPAVGPFQINLSWTEPASSRPVTGFQIYRNGSLLTTVSGTTFAYSDTTVLDGSTYSYYLVALLSPYGNSANSNTVSATTPLAAPSGVLAAVTPVPPLGVIVTWTNNSKTATGFIIQRASNSTFTAAVRNFTVGAVTTYTDTTVAANTTYYYRVEATLGATTSAWSTPAATVVTSAPAAPSNFTATSIASTSVTVQWTDNSTNEGGFTIQYATNSGFTQNVGNAAAPAHAGTGTVSFTVTGLSATTRYYMRIRAFNGAGNSAWANLPNPGYITTTK